MHSSTSSSEDNAGWRRTGLVFIAASVVLFGAAEYVSRAHGRRPVLQQNDLRLWSETRAKLSTLGPQDVVFVGASRIARGLHGPELERQFSKDHYLQLGVDGCLPGGTIEDVLADPNFAGVVVTSVFVTEAAITADVDPWAPCQQRFVDYFHNDWSTVDHFEWQFQKKVKLSLSLLSWSHWDLLPYLQGRGVHQPVLQFRVDRANPMDFGLPYWQALAPSRAKKNRAQLARLEETIDTPGVFEQIVAKSDKFEGHIQRFQARGGRFVYLRMPSSNPTHPHIYRQLKSRFWDKLKARTSAQTIHFLDVEGMRELKTPDGSHLHARDTPHFTRVLAQELRQRGLLKPAQRNQ